MSRPLATTSHPVERRTPFVANCAEVDFCLGRFALGAGRPIGELFGRFRDAFSLAPLFPDVRFRAVADCAEVGALDLRRFDLTPRDSAGLPIGELVSRFRGAFSLASLPEGAIELESGAGSIELE